MLKIAVAVATADALPNAFVVWRGIEESIRKAAEYGYDGIELALQTAEQIDAGKMRALLVGITCAVRSSPPGRCLPVWACILPRGMRKSAGR